MVRKEAKKANDPIYGRDMMNSSTSVKHRHNEKSTTFSKPKPNFATNTAKSQTSANNHASIEQPKPKFIPYVKPCIYCQGKSHTLEEWKNIMKLPLRDKYAVLK